jgi:hypothetical protein
MIVIRTTGGGWWGGATDADRERWANLVNTVAGADKVLIQGSRGVVNRVWYLKPDRVAARLALPAGHPHHVGPCVPGPILTDVER